MAPPSCATRPARAAPPRRTRGNKNTCADCATPPGSQLLGNQQFSPPDQVVRRRVSGCARSGCADRRRVPAKGIKPQLRARGMQAGRDAKRPVVSVRLPAASECSPGTAAARRGAPLQQHRRSALAGARPSPSAAEPYAFKGKRSPFAAACAAARTRARCMQLWADALCTASGARGAARKRKRKERGHSTSSHTTPHRSTPHHSTSFHTDIRSPHAHNPPRRLASRHRQGV